MDICEKIRGNLRKEEREYLDSLQEEIDNSSFVKVEIRENGDRFVQNPGQAYLIDGVTGKIKEWYTGGPEFWREAYFGDNGIFGPGNEKGLVPKHKIIYR